jgi:hypothetical protein
MPSLSQPSRSALKRDHHTLSIRLPGLSKRTTPPRHSSGPSEQGPRTHNVQGVSHPGTTPIHSENGTVTENLRECHPTFYRGSDTLIPAFEFFPPSRYFPTTNSYLPNRNFGRITPIQYHYGASHHKPYFIPPSTTRFTTKSWSLTCRKNPRNPRRILSESYTTTPQSNSSCLSRKRSGAHRRKPPRQTIPYNSESQLCYAGARS